MQVATIDSSKEWTVEDYLQLDEGLLAQLIDGRLITSPAPNTKHQRVLKKLFLLFESFLEGETFFAPIDLFLDKKNIFQPDLIYVSKERTKIITDKGVEGIPDLIVEVISPSNSFIDRNTKKRKYLITGVKEYWIVDPANETMEIYTPQNEDQPRLYLAKEGKVTTLISGNLVFELDQLFKS